VLSGEGAPKEESMQYALLIYADEASLADQPMDAHSDEMGIFVKEIADRIRGGVPLAPTAASTTVRVRDGQTLTTDGPFAETKEALAGFFVIEAENLDEALEIAARNPGARRGSIEVRPVAIEIQDAVNRAAGG
jgi:hypothetical protein